MRLSWPKFHLPLLGKELVEQAARPQTYILRVAYAILLFVGLAMYSSSGTMTWNVSPAQLMGSGRRLFEPLVGLQLAGIFLFLPALMGSSITYEKERDTLSLLFLTDLRPWELILQKYIGRLVPMFTFLLTSLPLMAVAYSMGGVSTQMLVGGICLLVLTCLQVGAFALMCSAYAATSLQAVLRCYLLGALFYVSTFGMGLPMWVQRPPPQSPWLPTAGFCAIAMGTTLIFLKRARRHLLTRATVAPRNPLSVQFTGLDRFTRESSRLLQALAKAVAGPARRGRMQLLGELLHLKVPAVLAGPTVIGAIMFFTHFMFALVYGSGRVDLSGWAWVVWGLAMLTLPAMAANAIAAERMNQRLDVLLTTPMTGKEILAIKLQPTWRWVGYLRTLLGTVLALQVALNVRAVTAGVMTVGDLLVSTFAAAAGILWYPALMGWLSLWIGLRIRSQLRALLTAVAVTVAWWFVPRLVMNTMDDGAIVAALQWIVPLPLGHLDPMSPVVRALSLHYVLPLLLFRGLCLRNADRYLGRVVAIDAGNPERVPA